MTSASAKSLLILGALVLGCGDKAAEDPATSGGNPEPDTASKPDSGDSGDDGPRPNNLRPDLSEVEFGPQTDFVTGIVMIEEDATTFSEHGVVRRVYEITSDFEIPFTYPVGGTPRFQILWPVDTKGAAPVMLALHPGAIDIDSEKEPEGAYGRCADTFGQDQTDDFLERTAALAFFSASGGVVVIPELSTCDWGLGHGPDDTVDPTHVGYLLTRVAMGYAQSSPSGPVIDNSRVSIFGARLGAVGASYYAALNPNVDRMLHVGAPTDMVRYRDDADYCQWEAERCQGWCDHTMGGAPYEDKKGDVQSALYDTYRKTSIARALMEGEYLMPVLHIYNSLDPVSPTIQHEDLSEVLQSKLGPEGLEWSEYDVGMVEASHDLVHASFHTGVLSAWFALGRPVELIEAESLSGKDWVGSVSDAVIAATSTSQDLLRASSAKEGIGTLLEAEMPVDHEAGDDILVTFVMGASDSKGSVARISLLSEGKELAGRDLHASELDYSAGRSVRTLRTWGKVTLRATSVGAPITARVVVSGVADVEIDAVIFGGAAQ